MSEFCRYFLSENFLGDKDFFKKVFSNPETVIFYDCDGILANTPKTVLRRFQDKTGIPASPDKITNWEYMTSLAVAAGLPEMQIKHIEDDWYKEEVLSEARRYLYMRPVVNKTIKLFGASRNYVLTAREPYLGPSTSKWIQDQYPGIPEGNILIRSDSKIESTAFKASQLATKARKAPYVVLVEDAIKNVKAALSLGIDNLLVVNIPLGLMIPDFTDDRLVVIKRFPEDKQVMYPLMDAIERATADI